MINNANSDEVRKNITKNITKYREAAGLSQKALAEKLHTTPSRVSNWEQGANSPSIDILFDLCNVLNVSINDIYGIYPTAQFTLSYAEQSLIERYRTLDPTGRDFVDSTMAHEGERATQIRELAGQSSSSSVSIGNNSTIGGGINVGDISCK